MGERGLAEAIFLERLEHPFDARGHHVATIGGHPAHRDLERRGVVEAMLEKCGADSELVEIGEQRKFRRVESKVQWHRRVDSNWWRAVGPAPRLSEAAREGPVAWAAASRPAAIR